MRTYSYRFGYTKQELADAARSLSILRYVGRWGGQANDDDAFVARLTRDAALTLAIPAGVLDSGHGLITIAGESVWATISSSEIRLEVIGIGAKHPYFIFDRELSRARRVDGELARLVEAGVSCIDPPEIGRCCVSPTEYPEIWRPSFLNRMRERLRFGVKFVDDRELV